MLFVGINNFIRSHLLM